MSSTGRGIVFAGVLGLATVLGIAFLKKPGQNSGPGGATEPSQAEKSSDDSRVERIWTYADPSSKTPEAQVFVDRAMIDAGVYQVPAAATGRVEHPESLSEWRKALNDRVPNALAALKIPQVITGTDVLLGLMPAAKAVTALKDRSSIRLYEGDFAAARADLQMAFELSAKPGVPPRERDEILALLGIAAFRRGEQANCIGCVGPSSCIFPIDPAAVHTVPDGSREAIAHFTAYLANRPGDLRIRWLLNLAYMTLGVYPEQVPTEFLIPLNTFRSTAEMPAFPNVATEAGLIARGPAQAGGAIFDDFTGDGRPDMFLSTIDIDRGATLWINKGDGTFEDGSKRAGLDDQTYALNLTAADFDNDGDLDVLLMRGGWESPMPLSLLRNDGTGVFEDVTVQAGLDKPIAAESSAWGDYDNDGLLDLFVCGEFKPSKPDSRNLCRLYHNEGNGRFIDVAEKAGVQNGRFAKGAVWGDYDNDGRLDLFVSNMTIGEPMASRFYRNQGDGHFTDMATVLGVGNPTRHFTCTFWDYDNDGWQDLLVSDHADSLGDVVASYLGVQTEHVYHPCLYKNMAGSGFREVSAEVGLNRPIPAMSLNIGDLDNDGWLDLHLGTGWMSYSGLMPDLTFKNQQGKSFADVTLATGTGHLQKGHGVSMADYDADGDLDLLVTFGGGYPGDQGYNALFQNPGDKAGNHWIKVKLEGRTTNRSAIGARIRVKAKRSDGSTVVIHRTVGNNGSFGGNPLEQHIGLGDAVAVESLTIEWPTSKTTQTLENVSLDGRLQIVEGELTGKPKE